MKGGGMVIGKQTAQVLAHINRCTERDGYPPTLRQLAAATAMSANGVRYHLAVLERAGYIRREPGASRGIQILRRALGKTAERKPRTAAAGAPA